MADFNLAYQIIHKNEGNYAWIPGDAGGETYGGITRNFNPEWQGWSVIDEYKKKVGTNVFRNNFLIPGLTDLVRDFYFSWWNRLGFENIVNQGVANISFDLIVNSNTSGILEIETVLFSKFGVLIRPNRVFNGETIKAINSIDGAKLYNGIKAEREKFYKRIAEVKKTYVVNPGDTVVSIALKFRLPLTDIPTALVPGRAILIPTNKQFLVGWLARLNGFAPMQMGAGVSALVVLGGLGYLLFGGGR